jgi:hypothetical protein
MSDSVKIVGTPYEDGQTKISVRSALRSAFPAYRVASILRDDENERWLARLVEQDGRVHHKLADDEDAPFPLKELGPEGDGKDEESDSASDDDSGDEPDTNKDDDELKPDEKPAEDDKADAKGELKDLIKQFKKLLPALEKVVGPIDDDEGPDDLDQMPEDIGPVPGNGGPGGPPLAPPGGPPPGGGGMPPRRPPVPPGAGGGRRPGGPPRPGVPTFTHAQELPLQRTADVTADEARTELLAAYPDYEIREFTETNGLFKVILERKDT